MNHCCCKKITNAPLEAKKAKSITKDAASKQKYRTVTMSGTYITNTLQLRGTKLQSDLVSTLVVLSKDPYQLTLKCNYARHEQSFDFSPYSSVKI